MELDPRPVRLATTVGSTLIASWSVLLDLQGHQEASLTTKPGSIVSASMRLDPTARSPLCSHNSLISKDHQSAPSLWEEQACRSHLKVSFIRQWHQRPQGCQLKGAGGQSSEPSLGTSVRIGEEIGTQGPAAGTPPCNTTTL